MSDQPTNSEYMLLFRGTDWQQDLAPQVIQDMMTRWTAWYDGLVRDGRAISGRPLGSEGKIVSGKNGRNIADGPFTESKESIGGYFLLRVADFDEAVAIARECPGLDYGLKVEVRQVAQQCAIEQAMNERLAGVTA